VHKNIFSFGDTCLTPHNEMKSIVSMHQYSAHIANNIQQTLNEGAKFMDIPGDMHKINAIPLGNKNGILCFNKMVAVNNGVMTMKKEIRDMTVGGFRN
jgi:NADH dehydrogenase FAD-containing subunit